MNIKLAKMLADNLGPLKKAKNGGYYYVIVGSRIPWVIAGKNRAAAMSGFKKARKAIKDNKNGEQDFFSASDKFIHGPMLVHRNKLVLVISPDSTATASPDKAIPRTARSLPKLGHESVKSKLGTIGALLNKAHILTEDDAKLLEESDQEDAVYNDEDIVFDAFDERDDANDVTQVTLTIAEQLHLLKAANDVAMSDKEYEEKLLRQFKSLYESTVTMMKDLMAFKSQKKIKSPLEDSFVDKSYDHIAKTSKKKVEKKIATDESVWINARIWEFRDRLLRLKEMAGQIPDEKYVIDKRPKLDKYMKLIQDFYRRIRADPSNKDSLSSEEQAQLERDMKRYRTGGIMLNTIKSRCLLCFDDIPFDTPSEELSFGHCPTVIFHKDCLHGLTVEQRVKYSIQEQGFGEPCLCKMCRQPINPVMLRPYLGRAGEETIQKLLRNMKRQMPPQDIDIKDKPLPIGVICCPKCKTAANIDIGCDIIHHCIVCNVSYDFVTGKKGKKNHGTAINLSLIHI